MATTELRYADPYTAVESLRATREEDGALVIDMKTDKIGYVMGCAGPYLQLRPPGGGREWDADPDAIRQATDTEVLRARVTEMNRAERRLG
ncbi:MULTISPECIES: hypothetical protein [Streptomyces]|uniref:hypothetical protein n=1 Tax=Streptomyces TaxID=1883 RepID=UPI000A65D9D3|nr:MULTISPECIES: hypothetical protein [Streptomyces]